MVAQSNAKAVIVMASMTRQVLQTRAAEYAHDGGQAICRATGGATPLRAGDRVLDAGTGTGFAAVAIAQRVGPDGHVLGVDISPRMLDQARL